MGEIRFHQNGMLELAADMSAPNRPEYHVRAGNDSYIFLLRAHGKPVALHNNRPVTAEVSQDGMIAVPMQSGNSLVFSQKQNEFGQMAATVGVQDAGTHAQNIQAEFNLSTGNYN